MRKPDTVWVRNNGAEDFNSRYDGEDFSIPAGAYVEMLAECATLCLGFGEEDKTRCLRRLGWSFTGDQVKEGEKRLAAFSFHMTEVEASGKKARSAAPAGGGEPSAPVHKADAGVAPTPDEGQLQPVLGKLAQATPAPAG